MFYSTEKLYIFENKDTIYRSGTALIPPGGKYLDAACLINTDGNDEPPIQLTSNTDLFIVQATSPNPIHTQWAEGRDHVSRLVLNPPDQAEVTKAYVFWSPFPHA